MSAYTCGECVFYSKGRCDLERRPAVKGSPACKHIEHKLHKHSSEGCSMTMDCRKICDIDYHGISSDLLDNRNYGG